MNRPKAHERRCSILEPCSVFISAASRKCRRGASQDGNSGDEFDFVPPLADMPGALTGNLAFIASLCR